MKLYMAVTADKYELPIAVCDNARELGQAIGLKQGDIYCRLSRPEANNGKRVGMRIVRVEVEQ